MGNNYIKNRLEPQMAFYKKKCAALQKEFYALSIISIIVNSIIPIFAIAVDTVGFLKYIVSSLSAVATICSSILLLRKTKDTWVECRSTYEQLKHEKIMFESKAGSYGSDDKSGFIAKCESIMDSEHSIWTQLMKDNENK